MLLKTLLHGAPHAHGGIDEQGAWSDSKEVHDEVIACILQVTSTCPGMRA